MVIDPTTGQPAPYPDWAIELARNCAGTMDTWTDWVNLDDGRSVRVRLTYDEWSREPWNEMSDGEVAEVRVAGGYVYGRRMGDGEGYSQRPSHFDGKARKLPTPHRRRGDPELWWQPPEDCPPGSACYEAIYQRFAGWLRDDWCWATVWVATKMPPCPCCGCRNTDHETCGGVESDADADYLADLIADMAQPLAPPTAHATHGEPII